MRNLKNSLIAIVGLTALVGLICLVAPTSGRGQGPDAPPTRDVNVVNTPSVNIVNPATSPALVRDVGIPIRAPVMIRVNLLLASDQTFGEADVYTVPEGKRLVIEHAALVNDTINVGNAVRTDLTTILNSELCSHPLDVREQDPVNGPLFVVNHPILAFGDPGTRVRVFVTLDQPIGGATVSAIRGTLSGYLESFP